MRTLLLLSLLGAAVADVTAKSHLDEYDTTAAGASLLPAPYKESVVFPGTKSPDGKYAFIYPNRQVVENLPKVEMNLVTLKPFRVVQKMPAFDEIIAGNTHGDFEAYWAKDSSAVTAIFDSKWGPERVYLIPLHDDKAGQIKDLTAEVTKLAMPDFKKAKAERYNDAIPFIFDQSTGWNINEKNEVVVDCVCNSDPNISREHPWSCSVKGRWSIAEAKWIEVKITRIPRPSN